ncbi:hypothetical protein PAEPH01_2505 [Pancytospora epiphaga]|nr:hypothetical protein PAEPH01_2505 [Pancytospora epiphaga]
MYHSAIGCAPIEAWSKDSDKLMIENSKGGKYAEKFNKGSRENFELGSQVRVAKRENLRKPKEYKGRFLDKGEVIEKCGSGSNLVRMSDNKIVKKQHYDLKLDDGICFNDGSVSNGGEATRLEEGML